MNEESTGKRTAHATERMTVQWDVVTRIASEAGLCPICDEAIQGFANYIFLAGTGEKVTICWQCANRLFEGAECALVKEEEVSDGRDEEVFSKQLAHVKQDVHRSGLRAIFQYVHRAQNSRR